MRLDGISGSVAAAVLVVGLWLGAEVVSAESSCGPFVLTDVAAELGLDFRHDRGSAGEKHLPETMGSGIAWIDFDGDGWWDLYAVQSGPFPPGRTPGPGNRLYRNLGDGRFADVTESAGAGDRGYGQGVVAADADGDGTTDLFVMNFGADRFFRNVGDGRFVDATGPAGLAIEGWSSSAAFGDGDGDGDLDLYVTRYVDYDPDHGIFCGDPEAGERQICDPSLFEGVGDRYLVNDGTGGFAEATDAAGLAPADGRGLGVVFTDLDGDGLPDLYVANDLTLNLLFRNRGDGTFEDLSLLSGTAVNRDGKAEAGMGIAVGDLDHDGDPDLGVTNFDVETNTLYLNRGGLFFEDVSAASGFGSPSFNLLAFGIVFADLDGDGDLDAFVGNGHVFETPRRAGIEFAQPDMVLEGDGRGRFERRSCPPVDGHRSVTRGVATADFDNDGDLDVATSANGGGLSLYRNDLGAGAWLGLRLRGGGANTEAVGARVALLGGEGERVRWVLAGESYQSSSDRRVLFRLPPEESGDGLEVLWPGGGRTVILDPPFGRYLVLGEGREAGS